MAITQTAAASDWDAGEMRLMHFFKNMFRRLFSDKLYLQKRQQEMLIKELRLKTSELENLKCELHEKNELLKKMSHHQNHTIRRPLANILGITKLLNTYAQDRPDEELAKLMDLLQSSSAELDEVLKEN